MAHTTEPSAKPAWRHLESAPFVYFDSAPVFGVLAGTIQIELGCRLLTLLSTEVGVEGVIGAHLRCSPAAAFELREALDKALKIFQAQQKEPGTRAADSNTVN